MGAPYVSAHASQVVHIYSYFAKYFYHVRAIHTPHTRKYIIHAWKYHIYSVYLLASNIVMHGTSAL